MNELVSLVTKKANETEHSQVKITATIVAIHANCVVLKSMSIIFSSKAIL